MAFRVGGRSLDPAAATDGTLCAAVPAGVSLAGSDRVVRPRLFARAIAVTG